ncbi:hypothetical protein [Pantanalinema sp. GBBB05]|uniref:hypothetical protein n=1 Tax=Pantanalinema sp. GBBB05 TaxID=2604139 RepID=UPI001D5918D1|nr:hypothetical protein [Pantanalinema sp. GBBB05]
MIDLFMNYKEICKELGINYYRSRPAKNGKKICSICEQTKPLVKFCKNQKYSKVDGHHAWCKQCTNEINENRDIQAKFARPPWFSENHNKQITALRNKAGFLEKITGEKHSICHIEPIQHCLTCGLDIPINMYVDTQANNAKNSNWFVSYHQLPDGTIKHIDLSSEFIFEAYAFNERFNRERNVEYRERSIAS